MPLRSVCGKTYNNENSITIVNHETGQLSQTDTLTMLLVDDDSHEDWITIVNLMQNDLAPALVEFWKYEKESMQKQLTAVTTNHMIAGRETKMFKKNWAFAHALNSTTLIATNVVQMANYLYNPREIFVRLIFETTPLFPTTQKTYLMSSQSQVPIGLKFTKYKRSNRRGGTSSSAMLVGNNNPVARPMTGTAASQSGVNEDDEDYC